MDPNINNKEINSNENNDMKNEIKFEEYYENNGPEENQMLPGGENIQNLNEINNKFLKEVESKINNGNALKNYNNDDLLNKSSNKSLNHGSNRNSFAYSNSTFNGTEIKLVDLNKLVNHQLPRNRLIPIRINDNDYLVSLNSK